MEKETNTQSPYYKKHKEIGEAASKDMQQ